MMIVRFPNGHAVKYNTAAFAKRHAGFTDLYDKDGGMWIAQVPNSALIEAVPACAVMQPQGVPTPEQAVEVVQKNLRALPCWKLNQLKRALSAYKPRSGTWIK